ncbi:MAG TPA: sialidase family protein, partial [Bacteroidia bacterium]|nr:sialidase family protein [Bacteroidia bacterium]
MKQFRFTFFICSIFSSAGFLSAQSNIPNVLVDPSAANAECTLIINPKNSNQILGAEIPDFIYRSTDAGLTWTRTNLSTFASTQISWDVALAADTAGHYFYQAMDPNNLFRTLRSDDYGSTWGTESSFGNSGCYEDKSWMTVDRSPASVYNGRIYSAWTLRYASGCDTAGYFFVNHSSDNGNTWSGK